MAASFRGENIRKSSTCSTCRRSPITASSMSIISVTRRLSRDAGLCVRRNTGATLSPFNGFLFLQGIQTLALRVERHVENARKVAEFLRAHPMVEWVNYVGFPDNPLYPMAHRYLGNNFCSLLTFGVKGGYEGRHEVLQRVPPV